MRIVSGADAAAEVEQLCNRALRLSKLEPKVRRIVNDVRRSGDHALSRYAQRWDGLAKGQSLRVSAAEIDQAMQSLSSDLRKALSQSAANIRRFCEWQMPKTWRRTRAGVLLGQIVRPLESVGCYVPGGRYPLVSTLLMTVIPAQVAGVTSIRAVSPKPSREMLGAAAMLGVQDVYRVGGAQAIAALAYGTKSIPRVDKIVGPGNAYITAAKKLVSFDCAIDFLAGPTEAVVLSDSGTPEFIAADLVSQSEHDPDALAVFITTSRKLATSVKRCVAELAKENSVARESLRRGGIILVASDRDQARAWANQIAPEHITIEPHDLPFIHNAGSVFVGEYSPQAAGDYASGPNHVLPTGGQARFRGGLSVLDFVKLITMQELSRDGLRSIATTVTRLAETEHLQAHAKSIQVRSAHA